MTEQPGARAERGEQELHLVLGDQPLGRLHGARRVRGVVDVDDLDPIGLAARLDAALGVGRRGPQVVAAFLLQPFRGERTRERPARASEDPRSRNAVEVGSGAKATNEEAFD